jgi:hypothetical protein
MGRIRTASPPWCSQPNGKDTTSKLNSCTSQYKDPKNGETGKEATADLDDESRFFPSCEVFKYLGTLISSPLDDTTDIKARIKKAYAAFNFMRPVLLNKKILHRLLAQIFKSTIINNALWGCDS